jgi:hypothetical protein
VDIDSSTWQALGVTLTLIGLLLSVLMWKRRGPASGLRAAAWSLLPAAAGLTGTLRLVWEIGESIVDWAVRLVFSPVVWLGIALAGVSLMLFAVSALLRSRGAVTAPATKPDADKQLGDRPSAPPAKRKAGNDDIEGMDDIEAILRKHGIS